MPTTTDATLTEGLRETAHRLTGVSQDYDPLMDRIGNARYVHAASDDVFAIEALADFRRFPTWMWRNTDVVEFLE
jgi:hypothetical protein